MSFPRAKRFIESQLCAPSPADYNLKAKLNATGVAIQKSDRFVQPSPSASDNGSQVSAISTPCFRTPTQVKKRKPILPLSARQPTVKSTIFDNSADAEIEALKDKIVECNNKDLFIHDLTEQIEDMKEQLSCMEKQKSNLHNDKLKYDMRLGELKEEHNILLQNIYLEHDQDIHNLKMQIHKESTDLVKAHEEYQNLKQLCDLENKKILNEIKEMKNVSSETIDKFNKEIVMKENCILEKDVKLNQLENKIKEMEINYENIIADLKKQHQFDVAALEFEILQSVAEMQAVLDIEKAQYEKDIEAIELGKTTEIQNLQKLFEAEKSTILTEADAKIKQVEENSKEANVLSEIQMLEKTKDIELSWKIKLENQEKEADAILKECQAISEYNIIECELEKKDIKQELADKLEILDALEIEKADLSRLCDELTCKINDLQSKLNCAVDEKNEILKLFEACKLELQHALQQKKMYEMSMGKIHETVEALKKRLMDSDRDVEQLKSELETCELNKLEFEGKCNQLNEELEVVSKLNEDLDIQHEKMMQMTDERCNKIENDLLNRVEEYRVLAQKEIDELTVKLNKKEAQLKEVLEELENSQTVNSQAQCLIDTARMEIDRLESQNIDKEYKIESLENSYAKVQLDLASAHKTSKKLEDANTEIKVSLDLKHEHNLALSKKLETMIENDQVDTLLKQVSILQEKSDSYYQYCDYYKLKSNEYEKEVEELGGINKKYIEQSGKFDALLQKFQSLELTNRDLEKKISNQEVLIGPFREQLEAYEMEHNALISQKSEAELEARNMGLKYAQLLGHQNQKQKIKHLMDLKNKNYELNENKKDMELKLKSQTRTIEKLKKELSNITKSPRKPKLHSSEKENVNSPNRTLNNSRVESPGLRERN